tara:strand:- start:493 stop:993 length:501 start_codon:yes stop_codon:yes gene_type:complete
MRTLLSFVSSLFSSVELSGCSAPTISNARYLDVSGLSDYFVQVQDKAVAYFVCGQALQKNPMFGDIDVSENFWCAFSVNGQAYGKLNTGVIAKLVLEPGQYTISCPDDPLAQIKTVTAILEPSSITTFVADSTQTVKLAGREVIHSVRAIEGSVPNNFKGRTPVSM